MPPRKRKIDKEKPETAAAGKAAAGKAAAGKAAAGKASAGKAATGKAAAGKAAASKASAGKGAAGKAAAGKGAASKASAGKAAAGKGAASKAATKGKNSEPKAKKAKQESSDVALGTAPVDVNCPSADKFHVFSDSEAIWDCMLNQTCIYGNNNKYYVIQLLQDNKNGDYSVWLRWGRVGLQGQTLLTPFESDLKGAKRKFCKKFKDKTDNKWYNRKNFVAQSSSYDLLQMDYSSTSVEKDVVDSALTKLEEVPESRLDKRVQELINLISDVKTMEEVVMEMKFDAKKSPIGKLTKGQIMQGYAALKKIEAMIQAGNVGEDLVYACDIFYTRIPHAFGMRQPDIIRSLAKVKEEMLLLAALDDIEIAMNIVSKTVGSYDGLNPIDQSYILLKCDIKPLDKSDQMYKILEKYLKNTHNPKHNSWSLQLMEVFQCDKAEDYSSTVGNKVLLWHGSSVTNFMGILSQGLRIAPPEAPVCGYRWGKGVYFSDSACKSAWHCRPTRSRNIGLLLLSEVKLGDLNELTYDDYRAKRLPAGKHSVKACGSFEPNASDVVTVDGDVSVPCGKLKEKKRGVHSNLIHNEYIVYNTNQIKLRYLLKVKFNY